MTGWARWVESSWLTFDTESTGVDTDTDRIVTASLLRVPPGSLVATRVWEWVADPGVEISPEAAEVHGYTTERARAEGMDAKTVIRGIADVLEQEWTPRVPMVICNAPFDLGILDSELRRHWGGAAQVTGYVLDPMVVDRSLDRYRRGSRTLGALCEHYGVELTQAHTASADALAGVGVMRRILEVFPKVGRWSLPELHHHQKVWRREWAAGLEAHLRTKKRDAGATQDEILGVVVDREWPLRSRVPAGAR